MFHLIINELLDPVYIALNAKEKSNEAACLILYSCKEYYSIVIHIFLDLHINFMKMNLSDCLDSIAFFAFRCNGTMVLAKIHRVIMSDLEKYKVECSFGDLFYKFLYGTAKHMFPNVKGVCSCTQNRWQGRVRVEWVNDSIHALRSWGID